MGSVEAASETRKRWERIDRVLRLEARRRRVPACEVDDAVQRAWLALAARPLAELSDDDVRNIAGGAWSSDRRTAKRRRAADQQGVLPDAGDGDADLVLALDARRSGTPPEDAEPLRHTRSKRTEPTRGRKAEAPEELPKLARAAALEILAKRQRQLSDDGFRFSGVRRIKAKKPNENGKEQGIDRLAAELNASVKLLVRKAKDRIKSAAHDPRSPMDKLLGAPEYGWMTATELAALSIAVEAVAIVDGKACFVGDGKAEALTPAAPKGREVVRSVMQWLRWRRPHK